MTAVQTGTAQAAAAPTLLDRMNPVTRLGLAVLASLPILITLDWVSALTMLCCQFGVFVACGVPVARLIRRTAPLLLVAPIGALSMALYGRPDEWRAVMRTAMARDFSWAEAGGRYLSLYRSLLPA